MQVSESAGRAALIEEEKQNLSAKLKHIEKELNVKGSFIEEKNKRFY